MPFNQAMKLFFPKQNYNISIHIIILLLAMKIAKEAGMVLKCQQSNQTVRLCWI